jgi:hypothetical protein
MAGIIIPYVISSKGVLYSIAATLALISLCYIPFIFVWYADEKFSLKLGGGRYLIWFLIVLSIVCLWIFMPVLLVLFILACILVILLPSKGQRESYPWKRKKPGSTWVLLGAGALVIFLLIFFISSNGFGMLSKPDENTRDPGQFEIRIVNSSGVPSKIMGTEGIQSVSDPHQSFSEIPWDITFTFTDEGAIAFRQAVINSGAPENPDKHPVSLVLDNKTISSQSLSQELANELKQREMKIVVASIGSGTYGQVQASNIVNTIRAGRGISWKLF